jgi:hypothetical protein
VNVAKMALANDDDVIKTFPRFRQLHLDLRQGTVDLIDLNGRMVERSKGPRLRTR